MDNAIVVMTPDQLSALVRSAVADGIAAGMQEATRRETYLKEVAAAEYVNVRPNTLRQWRAQGIGPAYIKMSKSVVYAMRDLDAWLATRRTPTIESPHV